MDLQVLIVEALRAEADRLNLSGDAVSEVVADALGNVAAHIEDGGA